MLGAAAIAFAVTVSPTLAADAGDAIDNRLTVATAAASGKIERKVAGHNGRLPVRVRNADCGTICINPQQCGNRQKPTPIIAWALPPPPPPPPLTMLGRATACWRARGSGAAAGRARRGSSRSGWRLVCLRRDRASSSSSFLREAVAGAFGFSSATQVSPFSVSPLLHSIGQTRVVCLASSATSSVVTLTLADG